MVSCIETASLIFAILSLLTTSLGFLAYSVFLVRLFIMMSNLTTEVEHKLNEQVLVSWLTDYALYSTIVLAVILAMLLIGLTFSIILTKGLISKNSHLVKAYFVYGVTGTTLSVLFGLYLTLVISVKIGLIILLGCVLYSSILTMIKKTYLKLAQNDHEQRCQKDVVAEKTISIKL